MIVPRAQDKLRAGWRYGASRLRVGAARLPILRAKEQLYDDAYYATMDVVHEPMYRALALAVLAHYRPAHVLDVGAGSGFMLSVLADRGVEVTGIEGSRHAIARSPVRDRMVRANLERGLPGLGSFDVAMCIEVAEHLPARAAARLVAGLSAAAPSVVFTAAPPGQGGTHHVNEQPPEYWTALFSAVGAVHDDAGEHALKEAIAGIAEPAWMHANLMVFRRAE